MNKDTYCIIFKYVDNLTKVRLTQVSKLFRKLIYDSLENIDPRTIIDNNMYLELTKLNIDKLDIYSYNDKKTVRYIIEKTNSRILLDAVNNVENRNIYPDCLYIAVLFKNYDLAAKYYKHLSKSYDNMMNIIIKITSNLPIDIIVSFIKKLNKSYNIDNLRNIRNLCI